MSGGSTATAVMAVAGAAIAYQNGEDQKKAAQDAQYQAEQNANKQAAAADQAFNAANQQKPDVSGILAAQQQAGKQGASGTMLTGPTGIDPSTLTLGKNTLLGA